MGVILSDEQFKEEMMKRREHMKLTQQDVFIGCPLCNVAPRLTFGPTPAPTNTDAPRTARPQQQQQ